LAVVLRHGRVLWKADASGRRVGLDGVGRKCCRIVNAVSASQQHFLRCVGVTAPTYPNFAGKHAEEALFSPLDFLAYLQG
jgi:hypothetical protein